MISTLFACLLVESIALATYYVYRRRKRISLTAPVDARTIEHEDNSVMGLKQHEDQVENDGEKKLSKTQFVQKQQAELTPTSLSNYFAVPHGRRMPFRMGEQMTYYQPVTVMQKIETEHEED